MTTNNEPAEQHLYVNTNPLYGRFYRTILTEDFRFLFLIGALLTTILVGFGSGIYGDFFAESTSEKLIATLVSWLCMASLILFSLYLFKLGRQLQSGRSWFSDKRSELKERLYRERKGHMSDLEHEFAAVSVFNKIMSFTISDGAGRERSMVIVEIEWATSDDFQPILYLYKDTGDMQTDVNKIRLRKGSSRLDFSKHGKSIRYVDANVQTNSTYNYYAWIEAVFYEELIMVAMDKRAHVVKFVESPREFVERKLTQHELDQKIRAAKTPPTPPPEPPRPLTLAEKVVSHLRNTVQKHKSAREAIQAMENSLSELEGAMNPKEILIIRTQMMQFIHGEFKR